MNIQLLVTRNIFPGCSCTFQPHLTSQRSIRRSTTYILLQPYAFSLRAKLPSATPQSGIANIHRARGTLSINTVLIVVTINIRGTIIFRSRTHSTRTTCTFSTLTNTSAAARPHTSSTSCRAFGTTSPISTFKTITTW